MINHINQHKKYKMAKKKIQLNSDFWHEATDRTNSVIEIIQHMLLDHPAIEQTPEIKKKVEKAQELLGEVYQDAGARM